MGIVISKEYQNLGYGNQAIKNLIKIARNSLKLKKIILEVLSFNERAIKLYLSLGFLNVGCMLKHYKYKGKLINVNIMEKIYDEGFNIATYVLTLVGFFNQIAMSDLFIHYDDVQFSKGSFVNRVNLKIL